MKEFDAYCPHCSKLSKGKINSITELESGNYIYKGECLECFYEVKRIVTKSKHLDYPESWYRHYPKGMDKR
jgi:hypothetical protein